MQSFIARARTLGLGAALAIASVGFFSAVPASASSSSWTVQVGNESAFSGVNRFYPDDITVHPGDTVSFAFNGFHTVTFNPPAKLYLFDFLGFNGPVGSSTLDTRHTFVNGSAVFGTPFVLTVGSNLPAGRYAYWCQIHQFMHGVIRVTNGPLPSTDTQNQALAQAQMTADSAKAAKLDAKLTKQASHKQGEALAGAGDRSIEFVKFYPSQITVAAGDELTFTDQDLHEPHTVSFGPIPGNPLVDPTFGAFPNGPGNPNAYDGTSALNSGWLFHRSQYDYWNLKVSPLKTAVPRTKFSVTFTTPGTYNFYCAIHGGYDPSTGAVFGMSGSITVLPAKPDDSHASN